MTAAKKLLPGRTRLRLVLYFGLSNPHFAGVIASARRKKGSPEKSLGWPEFYKMNNYT